MRDAYLIHTLQIKFSLSRLVQIKRAHIGQSSPIDSVEGLEGCTGLMQPSAQDIEMTFEGYASITLSIVNIRFLSDDPELWLLLLSRANATSGKTNATVSMSLRTKSMHR